MAVFQQTTRDYAEKPETVSMTLLIPNEYHQYLREQARREDVSMAHIIRKIIKAHCEKGL